MTELNHEQLSAPEEEALKEITRGVIEKFEKVLNYLGEKIEEADTGHLDRLNKSYSFKINSTETEKTIQKVYEKLREENIPVSDQGEFEINGIGYEIIIDNYAEGIIISCKAKKKSELDTPTN